MIPRISRSSSASSTEVWSGAAKALPKINKASLFKVNSVGQHVKFKTSVASYSTAQSQPMSLRDSHDFSPIESPSKSFHQVSTALSIIKRSTQEVALYQKPNDEVKLYEEPEVGIELAIEKSHEFILDIESPKAEGVVNETQAKIKPFQHDIRAQLLEEMPETEKGPEGEEGSWRKDAMLTAAFLFILGELLSPSDDANEEDLVPHIDKVTQTVVDEFEIKKNELAALKDNSQIVESVKTTIMQLPDTPDRQALLEQVDDIVNDFNKVVDQYIDALDQDVKEIKSLRAELSSDSSVKVDDRVRKFGVAMASSLLSLNPFIAGATSVVAEAFTNSALTPGEARLKFQESLNSLEKIPKKGGDLSSLEGLFLQHGIPGAVMGAPAEMAGIATDKIVDNAFGNMLGNYIKNCALKGIATSLPGFLIRNAVSKEISPFVGRQELDNVLKDSQTEVVKTRVISSIKTNLEDRLAGVKQGHVATLKDLEEISQLTSDILERAHETKAPVVQNLFSRAIGYLGFDMSNAKLWSFKHKVMAF